MLMTILINNIKSLCLVCLFISPITMIGQYVDDLYYNDNEIDYSYLYDSNENDEDYLDEDYLDEDYLDEDYLDEDYLD